MANQNAGFALVHVLGDTALFTMATMLVFKLSCKLAMGYARGQTLEKKANYGKSVRRNIEKHFRV